MSEISELAVIDPSAEIGKNVRVGPFCAIGPGVVIGDGCQLKNNVTVEGPCRIGPDNVFYQNVVIGAVPQDLKYKGEPTETIIGAVNVFRENCTVHRGTELGGYKTVIGDRNLLMVGSHIAHDCVLGSRILLANQVQLAGHVVVEDGAVISAFVGLHHFVTVGKYSYVGGMTPVRRDVPPFMKFSGDPNSVRAVNEEGLRRNGFGDSDIAEFKKAFRTLFRQKNLAAGLRQLGSDCCGNEHVAYLCDFMNRSVASRFGRFRENARQDAQEDRLGRCPADVRAKIK